ncbi:MAG: choice-of-anchor J domain-containing protein [Crocinitomicaceae bacterium]|nr:choice-of-anchor J domain-containing protein [Crocinitomicaceae bacterium]
MIKNLCFSTLAFISLTINAQTMLIEESFTVEIPNSFAIIDVDEQTPVISSPSFDQAWIHYTEGGDTCAASTSYYEPVGASEDYLILPKINLGSFTKLHWWGKSVDASYPEAYLVLISTSDSLTSSFTDTLMYIPEESPYWEGYTVLFQDSGYANQEVYVAFKNISNDEYILLIDDIKVSTSEFASINENNLEVSVFPNPVVDNLTISTEEFLISVRISNILGEEIMESDQKYIDVSMLDAGVYFVEVETKSGTATKKIIKR